MAGKVQHNTEMMRSSERERGGREEGSKRWRGRKSGDERDQAGNSWE
jgi:hypothetical protein